MSENMFVFLSSLSVTSYFICTFVSKVCLLAFPPVVQKSRIRVHIHKTWHNKILCTTKSYIQYTEGEKVNLCVKFDYMLCKWSMCIFSIR